jgi:uncharacterized protein involved in exopolysaccharide biosynthesis
MTELEKHLLAALEQTQQQQKQREAALFKMFEITQQENLEIRAEFQSLLLNISETDQIRNEKLNNLIQHVNSLNEQIQSLEKQLSKLKK